MKNNGLHIFLFVIASLLTIDTKAQNNSWDLGPQKGFVFEISNKEAQNLLTKSKSDTIVKSMLHTVIDTFDIKTGWQDRPYKGHFILASILKNKIYQ